MNNQEYLIQILLKLRSVGVKNDKILGAIEKIPPHFYYNLFNSSKDIKKIDIDEVLEIAKLLQLSLKDNYKNENIYPEKCDHCKICHWIDECEKQWKNDDYINQVAKIRRSQIEKFKKEKLAGHITLLKGERSELATLASSVI